MRVALGIILALFLICFIAIIIEETFFGGRRRRQAVKQARARMIAAEQANTPATDQAPQS